MNLLDVRKVSIQFGGLRALDKVTFSMEKGQVYSLIGPNGAGKTTILNCISRIYRPQGGSIEFEGRNIMDLSPHMIAQIAIARTFQNIELFSNMTVMDNLLLARHRVKRSNFLTEMIFSPSVRRQEIAFRKVVEEVIDFLELHPYRDTKVINLPFGTRKLVELARALAMDPTLLLLDEPSSGMNPEEKEDLSHTIRDIQRQLKISILMVEHDMNLVMQISDRVCVLNYGSVIADGYPEEIQENQEVIEAYLGEDNGILA
ncbi:MAG: ABC transporter ATP-binding protein [Pseudomonadota bacterium]